jgi:hypothetical protein
LGVLEKQAAGRIDRGKTQEVLGRMTNEELDAYEAAGVRSEAGEEPTEEDRLIAARVLTIREEVAA